MAIGGIRHRAVIDFIEDGTEAAAVTAPAMTGAPRLPRPEEPQEFHVDRPFLFAVSDDATGVILFQGQITDPR
jgi:serpin B